MKTLTNIVCPNCGRKSLYSIDVQTYPIKQFVTCSIEDGGCKAEFAVEAVAEVKVELFEVVKIKRGGGHE